MYIVELTNNGVTVPIHDAKRKLSSGSVVQGINAIDSFTFTATPFNPAFNNVHDFTTLVSVYNTRRQRYEFRGRVLFASHTMAESGLLTQDVTCESFLGYLCDSQQVYVEERQWSVTGLFRYLLEQHNARVEPSKRFALGSMLVNPDSLSITCGIQRDNTFNTIKTKLLDVVGGELNVRVVNNTLFLDYLQARGETKTTELALSRNMKSIVKDRDPSGIVTRLIPYGCKQGETEERLDIKSVNDGLDYVEDAEGVAKYGIHEATVEWDNITLPENLRAAARVWLKENNRIRVKYSVTALDLSLLGLDIDDFELGNSHPVKNALLGIDDVVRITKKTIDICEETKTSIELGERLKTLSEMQREQKQQGQAKYEAMLSEVKKNTDAAVKEIRSAIGEEPDGSLTLIPGTYLKPDGLKTLLQQFLDEGGYVTKSEVDTKLEGYVTESEVNTKLEDYVTEGEVDTKLKDYTTKEEVDTKLEDYVTEGEVDTKLEDYVTESEVNTKLEDYTTESEVRDLIDEALNDNGDGPGGGDSGGSDSGESGGEAPDEYSFVTDEIDMNQFPTGEGGDQTLTTSEGLELNIPPAEALSPFPMTIDAGDNSEEKALYRVTIVLDSPVALELTSATYPEGEESPDEYTFVQSYDDGSGESSITGDVIDWKSVPNQTGVVSMTVELRVRNQ